jgi:arabinofuranosyltransferase
MLNDDSFTRNATAVFSVVAMVFFIFYLTQFSSYTMDDAFITFRYGRNFSNGHGMVFNPGEYPRSEGITSPLYAILMSIPFMVGIDAVLFSKWVGVASTLVKGLVLFMAIFQLVKMTTNANSRLSVIVAGLGIVVFFSDPYNAGNTISGMETAVAGFVCLLLAYIFMNVLMKPSGYWRRHPIVILVMGGLLPPLFRPELALFVVSLFLFSFLFFPSQRRTLLLAFIGFFTLGGAYFAGRYLYYGLPFPLPFYIKQTFSSLNGFSITFRYVRQISPLIPFLAVLAVWTVRSLFRPNHSAWALAAVFSIAACLQVLYYITVTQLMGMGFRFYQPIHGLVILLASLGFAITWQAASAMRSEKAIKCASIFLMALLVLSHMYSYSAAKIIYRDRNAKAVSRSITLALGMKAAAQGQQMTVALCDCGNIPFYTDFKIIDLVGLNTRHIAMDSTSKSRLDRIVKEECDIVILVSSAMHDFSSLKGWEKLSVDQVQQLGYRYFGSMMLNETYYYQIFARGVERIKSFMQKLEESKLLDPPPAGYSH